jgi:hypothetical protein
MKRGLYVQRFRRLDRKSLRFAAGVVIISASVLVPLVTSDLSSASSTIPTCSTSQVTIALEAPSGIYADAGNEGFAFLIVNVSHDACHLKGYPKLKFFPASYQGKSNVVNQNGGGEVFVAMPPRAVVIEPGATASFGLNYVDAANQGDPNGGPCVTQSVTAWLPTSPHPYSVPRTVAISLNFCFANFRFGVTAIQTGPLPKTN